MIPRIIKKISLKNWPRRSHHQFFTKSFINPHFSLTTTMDISKFYRTCRNSKLSLFHSTVYLICKSLNLIPEYRQRLRKNAVIEWNRVDPIYTVMGRKGHFLACSVIYQPNFNKFYSDSKNQSQTIEKTESSLKIMTDKSDHYLLLSCLPWISFTGLTHPARHPNQMDSIPRITWGKISFNGRKIMMPVNMSAHHSLMDAFHIGKAFNQLEQEFNDFKPS